MAKKLVIASGKGGVGKTTIAVGLAKALTAAGQRVLVLDFDNLRSVDLMLGAAQEVLFDWGDVVLGRCAAQDAVRSAQGVAFLACPPVYDGIQTHDIKALVRQLEGDYDYLLFDAPAGVGTGLMLACAAAQRMLVVATPDAVSVRAACRTAQEAERFGVSNSRLIINRAVKRDMRRKRLLNIDDVIDKTAVQLIAIIPEDRRLRTAGAQGGVFLPQQRSCAAFRNLAQRVQGKNVPLTFM